MIPGRPASTQTPNPSCALVAEVPNRKLLKAIVTQATEKASSFGAHRSVRLLTALAKLAFLDQSVELGDLTAALAANIQLLHMRMGAQEVGIEK